MLESFKGFVLAHLFGLTSSYKGSAAEFLSLCAATSMQYAFSSTCDLKTVREIDKCDILM